MSFQGNQILGRLLSQLGLMLAAIMLCAMSCQRWRGAVLVWSTCGACLQVQWSQGGIRDHMELLSMEVAEPKYPTVTTLGNNKGLSLPGV